MRRRLPVAKAKAIGAEVKNPQRHRTRRAPKVKPLGGPSDWLDVYGKRAFQRFRAELPWLMESHRVLVEIASHLRGKLVDPEAVLSLTGMQELRRCLAQLGATPADESKVTIPNADDEDPDEAFFARPGSKPH